MSTNFYAKWPNQPTDEEGLHIGKRSVGWEFLWRAHPDIGLVSTVTWSQFLGHPWVTIVAETGVEMTLDEFWVIGTARAKNREHFDTTAGYRPGAQQWRDRNGFPFASYEFC